MRASCEWLCELAGIRDLPPEEVARILTMIGFNVDSVQRVDRSAIVIGRVLSQEPHPSSRHPLWVHQVDLGTETRQIIAGAPNAGPGALVPVALPGTTVPGGRYVRDAEIAGVAGRGMLCSAAELLLPPDPVDGILVLEDGYPGQHLDQVIPDDAVLDVEVEPNRPDCLGHLHLARELAGARGRTLERDLMPPFTGGVEPPGVDLARVDIEAPDLCRRYIGAVVSGVAVGPSPEWLRRRLFRVGVRPINNVVDVTNYVM
ncbi:MAG: phenylalanine--tRNA ligase beta subunit-related protein, partial [Candidatus Dormibacteraceae bacterium]